MKGQDWRHARWLFCSFAVFLAACATTEPSRFYLLSPMPDHGQGGQLTAEAEHCRRVGIGPVSLPEYLDRPQIVTRKALNQLELAEFDQWAEPLKSNFTQVLTENLSSLLCAEGLDVFPWRGSGPPEYQVAVDVLRLDGEQGREAVLIAQWAVLVDGGSGVLVKKRGTYKELAGKGGYEALVAAQSRAVANLSRDIGAALRDLLR
jgi:uncharacterized lipoprotein YmbA